jgi:hypothetical protein
LLNKAQLLNVDEAGDLEDDFDEAQAEEAVELYLGFDQGWIYCFVAPFPNEINTLYYSYEEDEQESCKKQGNLGGTVPGEGPRLGLVFSPVVDVQAVND